jgi:hypothetical protein
MLEDRMSVWLKSEPADLSLTGRDGELVSVSICVDPRELELLLESLSQVSFPINPQIYHDAALVRRYSDQHEEAEAATLVEFPAYAGQLADVRRALEAYGFDPAGVQVTSMLAEIRAEHPIAPAPAGAKYVGTYRLKRRIAGATQA